MNQKNNNNKQQNNESIPSIFYHIGNGSNDGSLLGNKTFHIVYYVLKHDFQFLSKTIIGILYNEFDKDKLYFQCIIPLSSTFSIPYLLRRVIYNTDRKYDSEMTKKVLLGDDFKKSILQYAEKILMSKIKQVDHIKENE